MVPERRAIRQKCICGHLWPNRNQDASESVSLSLVGSPPRCLVSRSNLRLTRNSLSECNRPCLCASEDELAAEYRWVAHSFERAGGDHQACAQSPVNCDVSSMNAKVQPREDVAFNFVGSVGSSRAGGIFECHCTHVMGVSFMCMCTQCTWGLTLWVTTSAEVVRDIT